MPKTSPEASIPAGPSIVAGFVLCGDVSKSRGTIPLMVSAAARMALGTNEAMANIM